MDAAERLARRLTALVLVALLAGCASSPEPLTSEQAQAQRWEQDALEWRERRLARLTEPYGWLSLVGLDFLDDGEWRVGSAPDNDWRVPSGPDRWGSLTVVGEQAWFDVAPDADVRVNGQPASSVAFYPADHPQANMIEAGSVQLQLLDRSGRLALRVRDSQAATRLNFAGLDYFPFDSAWRIEANWIEHPEGRTLLIANVLGELVREPNPGLAEFEFDGRNFGLEAVDSGDQLFFILADRTSGRKTYGLGRFLYSDLPENGRVVLDFNRAYNPPCAYTEFSTCPLPPPENRLDIRVTAGELAPK